eukprot:2798699-Pyramimonas_sp.AAC.1
MQRPRHLRRGVSQALQLKLNRQARTARGASRQPPAAVQLSGARAAVPGRQCAAAPPGEDCGPG